LDCNELEIPKTTPALTKPLLEYPMAEQFLLPNATSKSVQQFMKNVKCTITDLAHEVVGWNDNSRAAYNGMMGLNGDAAILNRGGLPPHFYIEIPAQASTDGIYADQGDFVRNLSRGVVPTALKALTDGADAWSQGRKPEALIAEVKRGNVSICIYHLDGAEVGSSERDKVNGFPKKA
jgi:hypothetical protein